MPHGIRPPKPPSSLVIDQIGHQWRGFEPTMYTCIEYQGGHDSLIGRELKILPGTKYTYRTDGDYLVAADKDAVFRVHGRTVQASHKGYSRSGGNPNESCQTQTCRTSMFYTTQPPYVALDLLERHGYKLVGTNTLNQNCIMWTLHKPAEAENRA